MLVHITGASGSGTSTLGRLLVTEHGFQQLDADDYYWQPTDPPYQRPRPVEERQRLLLADLQLRTKQVITGSFVGWGDVFIPYLDLVVFLQVPTDERLHRLRQRELARFGWNQLRPGGVMHENHEEFLQWAARYDSGGLDMRSLARHESWLTQIPCPVVRITGILKPAAALRLLEILLGKVMSHHDE